MLTPDSKLTLSLGTGRGAGKNESAIKSWQFGFEQLKAAKNIRNHVRMQKFVLKISIGKKKKHRFFFSFQIDFDGTLNHQCFDSDRLSNEKKLDLFLSNR